MKERKYIRALTREDVAAICQLECRCFQDPWSEQVIRESLGYPGGEAAGLFVDSRLCGYYFTGRVLDEGELMNLCVDGEFRRRGFARALLGHMEGEMKTGGVRCIYLEVRKRNTPARNLYLSEGYEEVGIRPGYYGDDDAVLMRKELLPAVM